MLSISIRAALLTSFVVLIAGCSITHFSVPMSSNPLEQVATQAAEEYNVSWVDETTLTLTETWPLHSIFSIGYTAFHANLHYSAGQLEGDFYLQSNQVGFLFIPIYIDTGPGFFGLALKPTMRGQMDQILGFAGTSTSQGTVKHGQTP